MHKTTPNSSLKSRKPASSQPGSTRARDEQDPALAPDPGHAPVPGQPSLAPEPPHGRGARLALRDRAQRPDCATACDRFNAEARRATEEPTCPSERTCAGGSAAFRDPAVPRPRPRGATEQGRAREQGKSLAVHRPLRCPAAHDMHLAGLGHNTALTSNFWYRSAAHCCGSGVPAR